MSRSGASAPSWTGAPRSQPRWPRPRPPAAGGRRSGRSWSCGRGRTWSRPRSPRRASARWRCRAGCSRRPPCTFNFAEDNRGSFEELYKSKKWGQISDNVAYPGITKGGHYHKYKKEIFMTIKGNTLIRERNINNNDMLIYATNGNNQQRVDIIPMYTHDIKNIGDDISITLMWISHIYDEQTSDTYKEDVDK